MGDLNTKSLTDSPTQRDSRSSWAAGLTLSADKALTFKSRTRTPPRGRLPRGSRPRGSSTRSTNKKIWRKEGRERRRRKRKDQLKRVGTREILNKHLRRLPRKEKRRNPSQ